MSYARTLGERDMWEDEKDLYLNYTRMDGRRKGRKKIIIRKLTL